MKLLKDNSQKLDNAANYMRSSGLGNMQQNFNSNNNIASNTINNSNTNTVSSNRQSGIEIETNLSKFNTNSNSIAFQMNSIVSSNLMTLNSSSSSSSSSAPTSSSLNENSSRIRHYSENSNDTTAIALQMGNENNAQNIFKTTYANITKGAKSENNRQLSEQNQANKNGRHYEPNPSSSQIQEPEFFTSNNLINALHADANEDTCMHHTNPVNMFEDEDDLSSLPNDIIEYNSNLNTDYFMNCKYSRTLPSNYTKSSTNNKPIELKNEEQSKLYLCCYHLIIENWFQEFLNLKKDPAQIKNFADKQDSHSKFVKKHLKPINKIGENTDFSMSVQDSNKLLVHSITNSMMNQGNDTVDLANNKPAGAQDYNFLKNLSTTMSRQSSVLFSKMDFNGYFQQLLVSYVDEENDLPTAIFMYLVASSNEKFEANKIDSRYLDEWFSQYIELLAMFELWNLRIEIIKSYQSDFIKTLTQKSINYNVMCATCKKTIKQNTFVCPNCAKNVFLCSYCHLPVKRLYAWSDNHQIYFILRIK